MTWYRNYWRVIVINQNLEWSQFFLAFIGLLGVRLIFIKLIPLKLISMDSALFIGFSLFLVFPIIVLYNSPQISIFEYIVWVITAYGFLLLGIFIAAYKFKNIKHVPLLQFNAKPLAYIIVVILLIFTFARFIVFLSNGGLAQVEIFWTQSSPHYNYLNAIGVMSTASTTDTTTFMENLLRFVFIICWGIAFQKYPKLSIVIWGLYIIPFAGVYMGRSAYIQWLLVPIISYWIITGIKFKKLVVYGGLLLVPFLVFFAWFGGFRLNAEKADGNITFEKVVYSIVETTNRSPVRAFYIRNSGFREDPEIYLLGMLSQPIPRMLWNDKPWIDNFNIKLTTIYTGRPISRSNTVNTFTIFGEGWYYFGVYGPLIICFIFGFFAKFFELFFLSNKIFVACYATLLFQAMIQIRSTFYNFYASGLNMTLVSVVMSLGIWFLLSSLHHSKYDSTENIGIETKLTMGGI